MVAGYRYHLLLTTYRASLGYRQPRYYLLPTTYYLLLRACTEHLLDVGRAEHAIHRDPVRMVARDQQVRLYGLLVGLGLGLGSDQQVGLYGLLVGLRVRVRVRE